MKTSINKLNAELKALSNAHLMINDYVWADFPTAINSKVIDYPLMNCYYTGGSMSSVLVPIQLFIVISDKVFKNGIEGNLNDTESDTLQVCRDIFTTIESSVRWKQIGRVNSCTVSKFLDRGADEVAGHVMQIDFTLFDSRSLCDLPLNGYDMNNPIPFPPVCEGVLITNSNGSFTYSALSGETYTLPNETFNVYVNGNLNQTFSLITLS